MSCESGMLFCDISLQQIVIHKLAKMCWRRSVLQEITGEEISLRQKIKNLIINRDKVLMNLPQILNDLPKQLFAKLFNAVIYLQRGYYEALTWEDKYKFSLPFSILDPLTAYNYEASNFIDLTGLFNDFTWVKMFVTDKNMNVCCRFQMACFYGLTDVVSDIWNILKTEGKLPCGNNLEQMKSMYDNLVVFWAFQLENRFDEINGLDTVQVGEFQLSCLNEAISEGHEYAAQFFWTDSSRYQQYKFMSSFDDNWLTFQAHKNCSGIVHFLYTLITVDHTHTASLLNHVDFAQLGIIWSCLLRSKYHKCALNDILTFHRQIPKHIYLHILESLTVNINNFEHPIDKNIFKILWNHFPRKPRLQVLHMTSFMFTTFAKLKDIDLLGTMIIPLPCTAKERILLNDWLGAGKSALEEISKAGTYKTMHYIFLFLIGIDSITKKVYVRAGVYGFLQRFKTYLLTCTITRESERQEFGKIIDCLQEALIFLNDIVYWVCEEFEV